MKKMSTEIWGVPSFFFGVFSAILGFDPSNFSWVRSWMDTFFSQSKAPLIKVIHLGGGKPGEACCISFVMAGEWGKGPGTWNIYTYIILDVSLHIDTLFFKKKQ